MATHALRPTLRAENTGGDDPVVTVQSSRLTHPAFLLLVGLVLATVPAALSTDEQHVRWGTPWYLTPVDYALMAGGGAALAVGLTVGLWRGAPLNGRALQISVPVRQLRRASNVLFTLCLLGYAVWWISALVHGMTPGLALDAVRGTPGAAYRAREALVTVPGVSTLTEVGPCLMAVLAILWKVSHKRPLMISTVLALSIARAFINSERLALILIAVPLVVVALTITGNQGAAPASRLRWVRAAVLGAPALLVLWFAITERGRSWGSHYATRFDGGLLAFSLDRVMAYYATAANNGAIYGDVYAPGLDRPELALQGVASAPVLGSLFNESHDGASNPWHGVLSAYSNPELNNPSSLLPMFAELGVAAILAIALWGLVLGRLYSGMASGNVSALVGYAFLCVGLLELPRYPYYMSSRAIVGLLAIVVVTLYVRKTEEDAHA